MTTTQDILGAVELELDFAREKHGILYASPYEALGVLSLEVAEVQAEIQKRDLSAARRELHQVAAVCVKAIQSIDRMQEASREG